MTDPDEVLFDGLKRGEIQETLRAFETLVVNGLRLRRYIVGLERTISKVHTAIEESDDDPESTLLEIAEIISAEGT